VSGGQQGQFFLAFVFILGVIFHRLVNAFFLLPVICAIIYQLLLYRRIASKKAQ
jgi:hypothetical protein